MSIHWSADKGPLDCSALRDLYLSHELTPTQLVQAILKRIRAAKGANVWITLAEESALLARAAHLESIVRSVGISSLPLYGIPFAVKDNINVAGMPTTAACREFSYVAKSSSPVVEKLLAAGAIFVGKTNLDQFATGLTGLLSSYGPTHNVFNPEYISGGSSSGSAVAVASGLVTFALGTDTAGSGRVPAAFNHLVGLKPTRGVLSTRDLVPACRSLDCLSFLTLNVNDAALLLSITKGFDPLDPFSRQQASTLDLNIVSLPVSTFRFGVPARDQLDFYGDHSAAALYEEAAGWLEQLGGKRVEIDVKPFLDVGRLLYQGPWIAERFHSVARFLEKNPDAFHEVTRAVISRGKSPSGAEVFAAFETLADLRRKTESQWALMEFLLLPTAGRIFTIAEAQQDPAAISAKLGLYTNFVNLLDLAAIAMPAGFTANKLPFGISLIGPAFSEPDLIAIGQRFYSQACGGLFGAAQFDSRKISPIAAVEEVIENRTAVCVVGAHLSSQPLNHQLIELDGKLVSRTRTAPLYRLYALPGASPPKPGLVRCGPADSGTAIEVEVWSLPNQNVAAFLSRVPTPLCLGNILLESGEGVKGFLCESFAIENATDISEFGGWLAYLKNLNRSAHAGIQP